MKRGMEFWLRVAAAVFVVGMVLLVPEILFPFGLSLILAVLLKPLADWLYDKARAARFVRMPYDVCIAAAFLLFIAALYFIITYVFVPFVKEFKEFAASVPGILSEIQQAIPRLEEQYNVSDMPAEVRQFIVSTLEKIGAYTLSLASISLSAMFSFASTVIELIVVPFNTIS